MQSTDGIQVLPPDAAGIEPLQGQPPTVNLQFFWEDEGGARTGQGELITVFGDGDINVSDGSLQSTEWFIASEQGKSHVKMHGIEVNETHRVSCAEKNQSSSGVHFGAYQFAGDFKICAKLINQHDGDIEMEITKYVREAESDWNEVIAIHRFILSLSVPCRVRLISASRNYANHPALVPATKFDSEGCAYITHP